MLLSCIATGVSLHIVKKSSLFSGSWSSGSCWPLNVCACVSFCRQIMIRGRTHVNGHYAEEFCH